MTDYQVSMLRQVAYDLTAAAGESRGRRERTMRRAAKVINEIVELSNDNPSNK